MTDDQLQPIIIKKKKRGHGGHHGGSWKVAFADFVTSLMAFFLVMWLISQAPEVREHVAGYFQDPTGYTKGGYKSILKGQGTSVIDLKHTNSLKREMQRKRREAETRRQLKKTAKKIIDKLKRMPAFKALSKQIEVQMTAEGLRIQLLETEGQPFFQKGCAQLLPNAKLLLKLLAQEIKLLPNRVILEGHTDSIKYASDATYTNWELSADRANSARRWLEASGLRPGQLTEVRGYGATKPKFVENPGDPRNRRIAIIVANDYSGLNFLDKNVLISEEDSPGQQEQNPSELEETPSSEDAKPLADGS